MLEIMQVGAADATEGNTNSHLLRSDVPDLKQLKPQIQRGMTDQSTHDFLQMSTGLKRSRHATIDIQNMSIDKA